MGAVASRDDAEGRIVSRDPATGEVLGEVPIQPPGEVRAAVARARAAQHAWGARSVSERAAQVARFRDLLVRRAPELCAQIARESGKTRDEALWLEVLPLADLATYFVKRAPRLLEPEAIGLHFLKNRSSYVHYVPRGVVGIISPWNFPLGIPIGEAVMALLAGNGVVLKPSDVTPLTALAAKALYDEAGLPEDLFQVVTGRGETGAALVDGGIDQCLFTGSTQTGRKVAAACGERLIPCTVELGGKAPAIVCADADLERTARALVWGAFANQGQICVSVERVYAHRAVHDELCERVVAETQALRLKQGDEEADVGAMAWDRQVAKVEELIQAAVAEGARIRAGGSRSGHGLQLQPTVLTGCRQEMRIFREEAFGPVMPILRVEGDEEAVRLANDSHLGLAAYVFTQDHAKGRRLAERLEAGTVMVNDCLITFAMPETPWGGLKQSGLGLTHGERGLRDLCQTRHVNLDRLALKRELWWYPYSERFTRRVLRGMRWFFR
jgi:succinate-semialdehyde dehydrogenase/glutarate-semialdehyde dehydrogenase